MVDTFRKVYPGRSRAYTCWNQQRNARDTNSGSRLDYILVAPSTGSLATHLVDAAVLASHRGSDHCPITATFDCTLESGTDPPPLCTSLHRAHPSNQHTLASFFPKRSREPKQQSVPKKAKSSSMPFVTSTGLSPVWGQLLGGRSKVPRCSHGDPCRSKTVTKQGPNHGRAFYTCPRPQPCGFFAWRAAPRGPPQT